MIIFKKGEQLPLTLKYLHADGIFDYDTKKGQLNDVDWGHDAFCSEEFPVLCTSGLSSCIGMYCFIDNSNKESKELLFGYLYHIWTNKLLYPDLKEKLLKLKMRILYTISESSHQKEKFRMGLVYGDNQREAKISNVLMIEDKFANLHKDLVQNGIEIVKDTPSYISRAVVIDPKGKGLVLSQNAVIKK